MNRISALVVDDEPLARQRICTLLSEYEEVVVVGECANGREAVGSIGQMKPDLIFLDIEMPEVNGFGVVEAIDSEFFPAIIFVTAYNEHAVKAFEVNALDYLLKPFDEDRFSIAIQRAKAHLASRQQLRGEFEQRMLSALEQIRAPEYAGRLVIKEEDRLCLIDVADVDWIEAAGKYVRLHTTGAVHLLREAMQNLEARLDPQKFARIHRSTIVNLDSVKSLEPTFHSEYRVTMNDGTELTLSRGYRAKLRERFGKLI